MTIPDEYNRVIVRREFTVAWPKSMDARHLEAVFEGLEADVRDYAADMVAQGWELSTPPERQYFVETRRPVNSRPASFFRLNRPHITETRSWDPATDSPVTDRRARMVCRIVAELTR